MSSTKRLSQNDIRSKLESGELQLLEPEQARAPVVVRYDRIAVNIMKDQDNLDLLNRHWKEFVEIIRVGLGGWHYERDSEHAGGWPIFCQRFTTRPAYQRDWILKCSLPKENFCQVWVIGPMLPEVWHEKVSNAKEIPSRGHGRLFPAHEDSPVLLPKHGYPWPLEVAGRIVFMNPWSRFYADYSDAVMECLTRLEAGGLAMDMQGVEFCLETVNPEKGKQLIRQSYPSKFFSRNVIHFQGNRTPIRGPSDDPLCHNEMYGWRARSPNDKRSSRERPTGGRLQQHDHVHREHVESLGGVTEFFRVERKVYRKYLRALAGKHNAYTCSRFLQILPAFIDDLFIFKRLNKKKLFKRFPELRGKVKLNGLSTRGQVYRLIEAGVPKAIVGRYLERVPRPSLVMYLYPDYIGERVDPEALFIADDPYIPPGVDVGQPGEFFKWMPNRNLIDLGTDDYLHTSPNEALYSKKLPRKEIGDAESRAVAVPTGGELDYLDDLNFDFPNDDLSGEMTSFIPGTCLASQRIGPCL